MAIISPDDVRVHLPGTRMAQYLAAWGTTAQQNRAIREAIDSAEAELQRQLRLRFAPTVIKCYPDDGLVEGTDYDATEQPYDYYAAQWQHWSWMALRWGPVQSVERVRITVGEQYKLATIDAQHIRIADDSRSIAIVPTPGAAFTTILIQTSGLVAPFMFGMVGHEMVPGTLAVDYTAGIANAESSDRWADLRRLVSLKAAQDVLLSLGDALEAGVGAVSLSGDGLSESRQLTKFQDRILALQARIDPLLRLFEATQTSIPLVSV